MWLTRFLQRLRPRRRSLELTGQALLIAGGQAFINAEDMIWRLGVQWAFLVAHEHTQAERQGIGADLFPPRHWARVREDVRRMMRPERLGTRG